MCVCNVSSTATYQVVRFIDPVFVVFWLCTHVISHLFFFALAVLLVAAALASTALVARRLSPAARGAPAAHDAALVRGLRGMLALNLGDPGKAVECFRRCVYWDADNLEYARWLRLAMQARRD